MRPTVFNYQQYTDLEADYMILKAENEQLKARLDMAEKAIAAWNRRAQPSEKPLTLDELRQMDGEPVWVTHKDGSGGRWGIVNSYKGAGMCADLDSYTAYWFDDWCGTIAYRRKPGEAANER